MISAMEQWLGLPISASAQAAQYDHLQAMLHWLMLVLFVGWTGFFVYLLVRFRQRKHPRAGYLGAKTKFAIYLAFVIAIIEIAIDTGWSVPIWEDKVDHFPPEKDAVSVHVIAEQFAWNVHYPGPDGIYGKRSIDLITPENPIGLDHTDPAAKDDIVTINQLNLPVDKPVIIHLTSKDVIHSFNLPVMRVKQDVVPGLNIPIWFTPTRIGNYEIGCAQLCGLGHYRMRGYLNILSATDYDKWVGETEKNLSATTDAERHDASTSADTIAAAAH